MAQGERSGKRGKPFERVVKEVLSTLDPRSVVRQGQWVTGPDGRRELDVLIEGSVEGVRRRVLVECKDFNPNTTGPVGIRFVDALESKRRDLAADVSFICSNAGFTTDAIRKAKRVGIGLIAVLRERDHRIRFQVREEIYIRRVTVQTLTIGLQTEPAVKLDGVPFEAITFKGVSVGNWVLRRALLLIGSNPIVAGTFKATHMLRAPWNLTCLLARLWRHAWTSISQFREVGSLNRLDWTLQQEFMIGSDGVCVSSQVRGSSTSRTSTLKRVTQLTDLQTPN